MPTTLPGGVVMPTDVIEYIHKARTEYAGTDFPDALPLANSLQEILRQKGFSLREIRRFSAWFVIALEGHNDQASIANHEILEALGEIDFKKYW